MKTGRAPRRHDGSAGRSAAARAPDPGGRAPARRPHGHAQPRNDLRVDRHADAAAELPLALLLCGGTAIVASAPGRREIRGEELFLGPYTTALAPDELLVETTWPALREGEGFAFDGAGPAERRLRALHGGGPRAGTDVRVVVGAVTPTPTLLEVDSERPGDSAAEQVEPWGSVHALPEYLRHLVRVLVDRVVARATEQAA